MKKNTILIIVIFGIIYFTSCKKEEDTIPSNVEYDTTKYSLSYAGLTPPNIPVDNPLTVQGVKLGRMLFYDKKLSGDGTLACSSCHAQGTGFSDTNRFSIGIQGLPGGRQAMATVNMLWNSNQFFWDGRANLLRDQALLPIQDPLEMHETLPNVISKLNSSQTYKDQFFRAFGSDEINSLKVSKALEQFMNSIVSNNSKYDKEERGEVTFTASEQRGKDLFNEEYNPFFPATSGADCAHCHSGPNFENDRYMNNGLDSDAGMADDGRMDATTDPADKGKFKVTTLRNIELTPPYMHDGRFSTLEEVVDHYNSGLVYSSTIDPALENTRTTGLFLTAQDKIDLVNFLKTLTDNELANDSRYSSPF
ncbi:MAG: cytochrome c peroxidase [Flavobacteriaceae bacterium]